MLNEKFIDENYEGLSIQLQNGFIKMNPNVEKALTILKIALENSNSQYLPCRVHSLYELNNWENKSKMLINKRKSLEKAYKEKKEKLRDRNKKLLSGEIFEVEWKKYSLTHWNSMSDIKIRNKKYRQDTKRGHLPADLKKAYSELIKGSYEEWISFINENEFLISKDGSIFTKWKTSNLHIDRNGNLNIRIEMPYIRIYEKGKISGNMQYVRTALLFDENNGYLMNYTSEIAKCNLTKLNNSNSQYFMFKEYDFFNNKFVKK